MEAQGVSALVHSLIGAIAGTVEVFIQHPYVALKNALQEGRAPSFYPSQLYRGLIVNAISFAPITGSQFGFSKFWGNLLERYTSHSMSPLESTLISMWAGINSSMVSCPAELLMINQQSQNTKIFQTASNIYKSFNVLKFYKGITSSAIRDGIYTGGYLGLAPVIQHYVRSNCSNSIIGRSDVTALLTGSLIGGVLASYLSHPLDTIKTRIQADLSNELGYSSTWGTTKMLHKEGGIPIFFKGAIPRCLRIIGSCFILLYVKDFLYSVVNNRKIDRY